MTFKETLKQVVQWLRQDKRVSSRALKRQFDLDDSYLDDLKEAILYAYPVEDDGQGMIWKGGDEVSTGDQQPATPSGISQVTTSAERRQLTVMFCDLVGSTTLSQKLDPEDLREVIRSYQATAAKAIEKFDGYIAQYLGDGLLVYFGWPRAHEDDPKRAVLSGLEIIGRVKENLNFDLKKQYKVKLSVRIGIHTGPVVVGQIGAAGRHENLAMGETVNVAARLEGLADPDTIVISSSTERLLHSAFAVNDIGHQNLKGVAESIIVYRVVGPRDVHHVEEGEKAQKAPFLVGRVEETGLLFRRWNQSKEGLGQVVLIAGTAGIGKSVLVATLQNQVRNQDLSYFTFRCASYHQNSALYPVISRLEKVLGFDLGDSKQDKRAKLEQYFQESDESMQESVWPLAKLLSISEDFDREEQEFTSPKLKQDILYALIAWLVWEAQKSATLIIWEDLHWADPSTLELIELLIDQSPTVPMLAVLTYRPEFEIPWRTRSHITSLTLNRLERAQTEALILHMTQGKTLPDEVVKHIITKTDGVPLFIEELTKMLLRSELLVEEESQFNLTGSLSDLAIPDTLQDSLAARLDQLNSAKEIAQLGSVVGREFKYQLLNAITPQEEETLHEGLKQLEDAEMLYRRGRVPHSTYIFKHALIQDAAYASLLKSKRQEIHGRIAKALESEFEDIRQNQPELIAKHYTEAGDAENACTYWLEAGRYARQHSAHPEAIAHLNMGLEMLETLPASEDRKSTELRLRASLAPSMIALKGYASEEVGELLVRAHDLSKQVSETQHIFPILWGLMSYHFVGADHLSAREVGKELLALAEISDDPLHFTLARHCLGMAEHCLGNFYTSIEHMKQGMVHYRPAHHKKHIVNFGVDFGIFIRSFAAQPFWFTGLHDQALGLSRDALSLARELNHPFSLSMACGYAATFHQIRRDVNSTYKMAEEAVKISTEHQFVYYYAWGRILRGWASAMQGNMESGTEDIRIGLQAFDETGSRRSKPFFLGILAEVKSSNDEVEEGLDILSKAFEESNRLQEPWWLPELHRLKGEMYLKLSNQEEEAERCFTEALDVARSQRAKSLELRSAISMTRFLQQQARVEQARSLLQPIFASFTEGFDTPDLQMARQLLGSLS